MVKQRSTTYGKNAIPTLVASSAQIGLRYASNLSAEGCRAAAHREGSSQINHRLRDRTNPKPCENDSGDIALGYR